ncbi:MAG: hypothetical protein K6T30_04315 [Alicyclobacillus sp.]|nr:hypothetical protein [Alicyclobacillus sp.]
MSTLQTRASANLFLFAIVITCVVVAAVWWVYREEARPGHNPPFAVLLNEERVAPNPRFDPAPASPSLYTRVPVWTADGHQAVLDARRRPILFVAYWCPHCQRTLVLLSQHQTKVGEMPDVVSMGFVPGTSLREAKQLTRQEEQALHLTGLANRTYYLVRPDANRYIPNAYPTLVFRHGWKLEMLSGEHTLQVWQTALDSR